jgi:hypothetical protein
LTRPASEASRYIGRETTVGGTRMPSSTSPYTFSRPGKEYVAKAYPASREMRVETRAPSTEYSRLLAIQRPNRPSWYAKRSAILPNRLNSPSRKPGLPNRSPLFLVALTSSQLSGIRV